MKKSLLLGAGFSYDFGMPLAAELTDVFLRLFNKRSAKKFGDLLSKHEPFGADRPINKKAIFEGIDLVLYYKAMQGGNYEELLANLQNLGNTAGKNQSDKDSYHYLFGRFYRIIHSILTQYQFESYQVLYPLNFQWFSKFENLLSDGETWVFTLNHDLYIECLAVDLGLPITYGDDKSISFPISNIEMDRGVEFTYSERNRLNVNYSNYFKKKKGINVVKLHGGLSEIEYKDGNLLCNQSLIKQNSSEIILDFKKICDMAYYHQGEKIHGGRDRIITNSDGELDIIRNSMLTGGKKYSNTTNIKKGEEKLKVFDDILQSTDELTIIGYGFGDSHINYRISNVIHWRIMML